MIRKQKTRAWLFSLAAVMLFFSNFFVGWAIEPDPNILWQSEDPEGLGYTGFVIHPNGNIISNRKCEFFEIDGKTGKYLRAFPVHYGYKDIVNVSVSIDGKYFASAYYGDSTDIYIFEYETGNVFKRLHNFAETVCFFPDSKRILMNSIYGGYTIYNLETDSSIYYGPTDQWTTNLAISPDGKYFASAGITFKGSEPKQYTVLNLCDTKTMKIIKQLGKIDGIEEVSSIKFSDDGKMVGFQVYYHDLYIYKTDDLSLFKHYNGGNTEFGVMKFCFIQKDYIGLSSIQDYENKNLIIRKFADDKQIYIKYGRAGDLEVNKLNNSLIAYNGNMAFNLNSIISSVTDMNQNQTISTQYNEEILTISNFTSNSNNTTFKIFDINGKLIKQFEITVNNSELKIPIKLTNGTYLLQIQDGSQQYSSKFMVEN